MYLVVFSPARLLNLNDFTSLSAALKISRRMTSDEFIWKVSYVSENYISLSNHCPIIQLCRLE